MRTRHHTGKLVVGSQAALDFVPSVTDDGCVMQPNHRAAMLDVDVASHCAEIERCNQRGSRMLSIIDLMEAGTVTRDQAALAFAAIRGGASFMIGALPGGAGKTTVMGALLNFVPPDVQLVPAEHDAALAAGLSPGRERCCYVCHEIGAGPYYAYLWGAPLRHYFALPDAGHCLATNLHADTYEQARSQVCDQNRVPLEHWYRIQLLIFLAVTRTASRTVRRVASVWAGDGRSEHRPVVKLDATPLATPDAMACARQTIDRLVASGARRIDEVRALLVKPGTAP